MLPFVSHSRHLRLCLGIVLALVPTGARAVFHDGGVANCGGCHVMHESSDGLPVNVGEQLLRGENATDTCLLCHRGGSWPVLGPSVFTPAAERGSGDFVFLLEDELNDATSAFGSGLGGETAGHSVVAPGHGLIADSRFPTAPGGNFPTADLGCTSCHDPHGTAAFRMLNGVGPVQGGLFQFSRPVPDASGITASIGPGVESSSLHSAYREGWAAWCGNCHGDDVHGPGSGFEHPVDIPLGTEIAKRYSDYGGDSEGAIGDPANAYLPEIPFVDPSAAVTSTFGPSASSRVDCMTCHRAHASSAPRAGRWDFRVSTLGEDGVRSGSYPIPNPYLDPGQRQLCVKCHDTQGHDMGRSCHQCHTRGLGGGGPTLPTPVQQ